MTLALVVSDQFVHGGARFFLGVFAGAIGTMYLALRESPPAHIEKWRLGYEGERRTAKALRPLACEGWVVLHDLIRPNGTNLDHVVVGERGVFLLDSKNYHGEARIEDGELHILRAEDVHGWTCQGIVGRTRAASAELKEGIHAGTGLRVWVQPVVVLWMSMPQRVVESQGVVFVEGQRLVEWLRSRPPRSRPLEVDSIVASLHPMLRASMPAPQDGRSSPEQTIR